MAAALLSLHSPPAMAKLRPSAARLSLSTGRLPPSAPRPTQSPPVKLAQSTQLLAPVTPACISSPFGPRVLPARPLAGTFHNGIDLPAPAGAPVQAIAPGVVIRVQEHGPGGLEMLVQHPGFVGIYSHLGMIAPAIADGQRVVYGGEKLGVVGHTGVTYGMHLFFGMIVGDRPVDPAPYLALGLCTAAHRSTGDTLAADGKMPPTRIYALVP
jgi:murein DD-endopeptidase MepM/ murein hydrolase activator NlpD